MIPPATVMTQPAVKRRVWAHLVVFAMFAFVFLAFEAIEVWMRPGWARGAMIWWAEGGPGASWVVLSFFVAVIIALLRPGLFLNVRRVAVMTAVLTVGGLLADVVVAGRPGVAIWPDRIERRYLTGREVVRPFDISRIEVACSGQDRPGRRNRSVAHVGYVVFSKSGERFDLARGRDDWAVPDLDWLATIDRLDRQWVDAGAPRTVAVDEDGIPTRRPHCVRNLPGSLGEEGFAQASRLLEIDDTVLRDFGMGPGTPYWY